MDDSYEWNKITNPPFPLQDSACLHWAIDHHVKSGSQKSRHATLLKNLRSLCPLLEPIPDAKIDKVVKFEALFNDRDEGVCNVKSCAKPMPKAYATESWEAAVLLNWPAAVAEMWEPLATSSSSSSSVSVKKQKSVADFFGKPSKKPKL